jgi:hypothetical protein
MSTLTLTQIKTEIKAHLGNRDDLDSRLESVIDLSQLRVARLRDFDELRVRDSVTCVVTSDAEADKIISFPTLTNARIRKVYSMRLLDSTNAQMARRLKKVLTSHWDTVIPEPEYYSRRTPTHYTTWENNQFELWPVPDEAYTIAIRCSRWPKAASVTGDGANLDLQNMDDLIINLSVSYLHHSLNRNDKAREFYGIYRGLAKEALDVEDDDFDLVMSAISNDNLGSTRGYDDPFVRMIE